MIVRSWQAALVALLATLACEGGTASPPQSQAPTQRAASQTPQQPAQNPPPPAKPAERLPAIAYDCPGVGTLGDVCLIDPNGGTSVRLVTNFSWPVWSRTGRLIAGTGEHPSDLTQQIYVFDVQRRSISQATNVAEPNSHFHLDWKAFSPRDDQLAFTAIDPARAVVWGVCNLANMPGQTYLDTRPVGVGVGWGIDWSPTASELVTAGVPIDVGAVSSALILVSIGANNQSRQLSHPQGSLDAIASDTFPAFSRSGRQVAFVRMITTFGTVVRSDLMVIGRDGTGEVQIATFKNETVDAVSWSPDGSQLVFDRVPANVAQAATQGSNGVWIIGVNGSGLRELVSPPAAHPNWRWAA